MLWLPDKANLKPNAPTRRRHYRRRLVRLLLLALVFFGLRTASVPPQHALLVDVDAITADHQFDFVEWESWAILDEVEERLNPPPLPATIDEQHVVVQTYLDQAQRTAEMERDLNRLYTVRSTQTADEAHQAMALTEALGAIQATQSQLTSQVETLLSRQVEAVLYDEGFTIGGMVFPPVAFRLMEPPTALVLSPRNRIENQ